MKQSFNVNQTWLVFITTIAIGITAHAESFEAQVSRFIDGDTIVIHKNGEDITLRIAEIDAPEINQDYGKKSKRALMQLCSNTRLYIQLLGKDKYRRIIGKVVCDETSVSQYMIEHGHAWLYHQYAHNPQLITAEHHAQQQKLGLWENPAPIPPWEWRHQYKH